MSEAIRFLHALAQAISTVSLYTPGHPATRRSADTLWQALEALLAVDPHPIFLFLGSTPVYNSRALHELRDWQHSQRFAESGIQRMEFTAEATQDSMQSMLDRITVRLTTGEPSRQEAEPLAGVAFGTVAVQEIAQLEEGDGEGVNVAGGIVEVQLDLTDELNAMQFVLDQARAGTVARAEIEAVNRILASLLTEYRLPQARYQGIGRYNLLHPVNTALLAMACVTAAGVDAPARHRVGVAALLHDIGMARLPDELGHLDHLNDEQRRIIERHPVEGAQLLLAHGGPGIDLAATVALEHHSRPDGQGYPERRLRPPAHWVSRLVGCCATVASLRAERPYRPAWSGDRVVDYLESGAGTVFDVEASALVVAELKAA